MESDPAVTLISVPVLVAVALAVTPGAVRLLGRHAGWPLVALFATAAWQLGRLAPDVFGGVPVTWHATWAADVLPGGMSADFSLQLDPLSFVFAMLALVIGSVVFIYSVSYLHEGDGIMSFYVLMTGFMLAVLLLVLADDVVLLFIAWELVSLASFMLIARSGSGGEDGAMRTLLLTFTGGLLLLAGLGLAVWATGTTDLTAMLSSTVWDDKPLFAALVGVLIAFAAFSKAAQFPFHPWLPEAMAAATPVSAFLHAAAVVKAGIYLLLRFSTAFHAVPAWQVTLIVVGMGTAVATAVFAIQQTDIKRLTAYSTVSQLGWIVATIGVGTHFAIMAAVVHTLAHAMFKSSLFMLAGVVDHQAGTRDMRRLGPLWRRMPWTFGAMVIGAASMAAVPPTFGFMSKEGMLEAFTEAPLSGAGVIVLLLAAGVGALATFTYSARLVLGVFVDGPRDVSDVREAPASLLIPAALPGVLSLPIVFFAGWLDKPLDEVSQAVLGGNWAQTHLALWHGVTVPLLISVAVLIAGMVLIIARRGVYQVVLERKLVPFTGVQAIAAGVNAARRVGTVLARPAMSHAPSRHLAPLLVLLGTYAAAVAVAPGVGGRPLAAKVEGIDQLSDLIPLAVVIIGALATVQARNRLQAAVLLGVTGTGVTLQVIMLGAPDVAMTQFMVEILTVVLMMLVLRHQPRAFTETTAARRAGAALVALAVGAATFGAVWALTGRRGKSEIAQWYLEQGPKITNEGNVVNTILVEFRAFDTMGELAVLGMAGVAMAAVVASIPRWPHDPAMPGELPERVLNALPMQMLVKWMVPFLFAISVIVLWRGGNEPGGGFNAALLGASALMMKYLAQPDDRDLFRHETPYLLSAGGVLIAIGTGFLGFAKGSFLAPLHGHLLHQHVTTALIFDVGVYLAVLGIVATALNFLGGPTRPGSEKPHGDLGRDTEQRTGINRPPMQVGTRGTLPHDVALPDGDEGDEELFAASLSSRAGKGSRRPAAPHSQEDDA
nr:DUF4040 family protein [Corynebacterium sp. TAE3-ERU12]